MDQQFPRTYLVVADDSPEMQVALRYAASRAKISKGRVFILNVLETDDSIQPWGSVDASITEDAAKRAREELVDCEKQVEISTGFKPELFIRKGSRKDVLLKFLKERADLSVLVLAAQTGQEGPGPLISYLTSPKGIGALKIPLVIVPDTYKMADGQLPPE